MTRGTPKIKQLQQGKDKKQETSKRHKGPMLTQKQARKTDPL